MSVRASSAAVLIAAIAAGAIKAPTVDHWLAIHIGTPRIPTFLHVLVGIVLRYQRVRHRPGSTRTMNEIRDWCGPADHADCRAGRADETEPRDRFVVDLRHREIGAQRVRGLRTRRRGSRSFALTGVMRPIMVGGWQRRPFADVSRDGPLHTRSSR